MAKGKSPGCDGFPAEFYQVFWAELYVNAISKAYREGVLSVTRRRGINSLSSAKRQVISETPKKLETHNSSKLRLQNCGQGYLLLSKGRDAKIK